MRGVPQVLSTNVLTDTYGASLARVGPLRPFRGPPVARLAEVPATTCTARAPEVKPCRPTPSRRATRLRRRGPAGDQRRLRAELRRARSCRPRHQPCVAADAAHTPAHAPPAGGQRRVSRVRRARAARRGLRHLRGPLLSDPLAGAVLLGLGGAQPESHLARRPALRGERGGFGALGGREAEGVVRELAQSKLGSRFQRRTRAAASQAAA